MKVYYYLNMFHMLMFMVSLLTEPFIFKEKKPPYSSVLKFMTFQHLRLPCLCLGNNFLFSKNLNMFWILCYTKLK